MSEWSVLIKVERADERLIKRMDLDALVALLPGDDKGSTGGDGTDATISFWVEASDAAAAVVEGWRHIEAARRDLGLDAWRPIRTHAASAAQRLTGFEGIEARVADATAWSVLVKAVSIEDRTRIDAEDRSRLVEELGADATVTGDDRTLAARFWVSAGDAAAANAAARTTMRSALTAIGQDDGWTFVRAHHAVASERAEEVYRGAEDRAARESGA